MSEQIQFNKRSECSAYVTVNGKTIYIEDSPATEGLYVHAWKGAEEVIELHPTGAGSYSEDNYE